jgi:nitroreductase
MPDALELLETRRTVSFVDLAEPGPSEDEIRRAITVAARVPDHGKLAPWRFVLVRGEARGELDRRLAPLIAGGRPDLPAAKAEFEKTRFSRVPLTVVVISKTVEHFKVPEWEQILSAGAATMNLMLAFHALGYSAQWLTGWCTYDTEALAILGVGAGERVAGFVAVGTPTKAPVERPRPSLADVLSDWRA